MWVTWTEIAQWISGCFFTGLIVGGGLMWYWFWTLDDREKRRKK